MSSSCCSNSCSFFRRLIPGRRSSTEVLLAPFSHMSALEKEVSNYPTDSMRAKLEQTKDPVAFMKAVLDFDRKDHIINILRLEKLLDHELFVDRMANVPEHAIRDEGIVPKRYDQDSLLYLKLKAELMVKQAEAKRLSTGDQVSTKLKNYDSVHAFSILQETFALFGKTLELFSFPFLDIKTETTDRIIGKRIQVCKRLFYMALRKFAIFICRLDFIRDDRLLEELDVTCGQFFQSVDRFLITMATLKRNDLEITGIEQVHKTNLKNLVSYTKAYCSASGKKQTAKMYQTLDLIRIRFDEALAKGELSIPQLDEEVAALGTRMNEYKDRGLLIAVDLTKKGIKRGGLQNIKEGQSDKDEEGELLSEDAEDGKGKGLATIKELDSNVDDFSSKHDNTRVLSHAGSQKDDLMSRMKEKHVTRDSFTLRKNVHYD